MQCHSEEYAGAAMDCKVLLAGDGEEEERGASAIYVSASAVCSLSK